MTIDYYVVYYSCSNYYGHYCSYISCTFKYWETEYLYCFSKKLHARIIDSNTFLKIAFISDIYIFEVC